MHPDSETSAYSLQPFLPEANRIYPIDAAAHLASVPRHLVLVCCKYGLVEPRVDPEYGGLYFDADTIRTLQRIGHLSDCGINFAGIRIILDLLDELNRQRADQPIGVE